MRTAGWLALAGVVGLAGGCAHEAAKVAPPAHGARVALLPAESEQFPAAATALNTALRDAPLDALGERFLSKVSLEVVQLSIECVDASAACYAAAGRALAADRLLFAQLAPNGHGLRVTVTLFDVRAAAPAKQSAGDFPDEQEAARGAARLVDTVVAPR